MHALLLHTFAGLAPTKQHTQAKGIHPLNDTSEPPPAKSLFHKHIRSQGLHSHYVVGMIFAVNSKSSSVRSHAGSLCFTLICGRVAPLASPRCSAATACPRGPTAASGDPPRSYAPPGKTEGRSNTPPSLLHSLSIADQRLQPSSRFSPNLYFDDLSAPPTSVGYAHARHDCTRLAERGSFAKYVSTLLHTRRL